MLADTSVSRFDIGWKRDLQSQTGPMSRATIAMKHALRARLIVFAGLAGAGAGAASAHHSPAMFDASKEITLAGTVKAFQWTSPHCWIQLLVPDADRPDGEPVEWGIEMDNPLGLLRHGWKPGSLSAGDEIVVVAHPLRDGTRGAQVVSVQTADGTPIGDSLVDK
jgi:Family of unknown function (DUF6152)